MDKFTQLREWADSLDQEKLVRLSVDLSRFEKETIITMVSELVEKLRLHSIMLAIGDKSPITMTDKIMLKLLMDTAGIDYNPYPRPKPGEPIKTMVDNN